MRETSAAHRLLIALLVAPLFLLSGCPGDPPAGRAGSPGSTSAKTTAPTLALPANGPAPKGNAAPRTVPASQTTLAQAPSAETQQKMQALINKAEASYLSGVENYRANRLDAARLDFDTAVDTLLTSGMDLKTESDLSEEFDRLLNAINSLEIAALKQGNGFSPKLETAPLDAANDLTFPANPELVAKLKGELNTTSDLPLLINDQVAGYIGVFSSSTAFRNHMAASLQRVGKYRGLIQDVLKQEGVPQDLIYLAVAESGFQPQALNARSGAGGMWQFMSGTGGAYGLTHNGFFDYRFDPEKSSHAYARYIKSLYKQFGDWYLAMAAYDWGPAYIQRAVQRTGYADFWELYRRNAMPAETRAYVPKILAAIIMAKNPERYGLDKLVPSPPVIYDTVPTTYAIDLRLVADVTNVSVAEIVALNPSLLRLTTPRDIGFDLHIPPGTKDLYADRLKDIPGDRRASWRFHVVKSGETLETIAATLHSRPSEIAETNGISPQDPMDVDDELVVPVQTSLAAEHPQRYSPRRGDTLVTVADRFNVSVEDLRKWNRLSSSSLRPGHMLYVAEPVRLAPSVRTRGRHGAHGRGRRGRAAIGRNASRATSHSARKAASRTSVRTGGHASARPSSRTAKAPSAAAGRVKSSRGKHKAAR